MTLVSSDSPSPMRTAGRELVGNLSTDGSQRISLVQQPSALERPQSFFPLHHMTINKWIQDKYSISTTQCSSSLNTTLARVFPAFGHGKLKVLKCHRNAKFDSAPRCTGVQWVTKIRRQKCTKERSAWERAQVGMDVSINHTTILTHFQFGITSLASVPKL